MVVPFPFTDRQASKRRPALVLSGEEFNRQGHTIMAMITTSTHSPWPGDTVIQHWDEAGLDRECVIRLKLFTLDNRLVIKTIGALHEQDRHRFDSALNDFLVPN